MTDRVRSGQSASRRGARRPAGFTLVEVLVAVAIVGILGAIGFIALRSAMDKARQRATMADLRQVASAIDRYIDDHGNLPRAGSIGELVAELTPRYAASLPVQDRWNNPIVYSNDGADGYRLESHGKDGLPGDDITLSTRFDFNLDIVLANGRFVAAPE